MPIALASSGMAWCSQTNSASPVFLPYMVGNTGIVMLVELRVYAQVVLNSEGRNGLKHTGMSSSDIRSNGGDVHVVGHPEFAVQNSGELQRPVKSLWRQVIALRGLFAVANQNNG